ncbi:hypothetical protein FNV43_RR13785 [Rhamnella rubrinervis]|uniref:Uncharacterized protein n=1 Tax=Rhamnella rubrinervis TaxID=2594499 RepID=A0A8K0MFM4_9ROSA|nr:hypothetical protein FNV43_RR13785 [Rhamnella rubrinervis]
MEKGVKGTVTSLSSFFPEEEAQKAASRVHNAIAEKHQELDHLRDFINDNTNLVSLVRGLPDQLHHDIMASPPPHTHSLFLLSFGCCLGLNLGTVYRYHLGRPRFSRAVLLGDGYYAERTCKQTVDILKRRGKALESHVDSLNAMVKDLEAEASFFDGTATEAKEGFLEIREDYVEESSTARESESGPHKQVSSSFPEADNKKIAVEDEEDAHMMARLDELEREEELAAERGDETDDDKSDDDESDEDEHTKVYLDSFSEQISLDQEPESWKPPVHAKCKNAMSEEITNKHHHHQDFTDQLNCADLTVKSMSKDKLSHGNTLASNVTISTEKTSMPSETKRVQATASSRSEAPLQTSKTQFDSQKAFTGSIVEHAYNLERNSSQQTAASSKSGSQQSKPVSRFKMQRK